MMVLNFPHLSLNVQALLRLLLDVLFGEIFAYGWLIESLHKKEPALSAKVCTGESIFLLFHSPSFCVLGTDR